jgi:hypothetical protein
MMQNMETIPTPMSTVEVPLPPPPLPPRKRMRLRSRNEQKREPSSPPPGRDEKARSSASVTSVEGSAMSKMAATAAVQTFAAKGAATVRVSSRPHLPAAPKPANAVLSHRLGGQCRNETFNTLDIPMHNVLTERNANVETHTLSSATSTSGIPAKIPGTVTAVSTVATTVAEPHSLEPIVAAVLQTAIPTECGRCTTHDNDAAVTRLGKRRRRRWDCRPETTLNAAMDVMDVCSLTTAIQECGTRSYTAPLLAAPVQPAETASWQRSASSSNGPRAEQSADKENAKPQRRGRDCTADSDVSSTAVPSVSSLTATMTSSGVHSSIPEHSNSLSTSMAHFTSSDMIELINLMACFDSDEDEPTFI